MWVRDNILLWAQLKKKKWSIHFLGPRPRPIHFQLINLLFKNILPLAELPGL
jgi:hypothetical protein